MPTPTKTFPNIDLTNAAVWPNQRAYHKFMSEAAEKAARMIEEASHPPLWTPNPDHEDGTPNPQRLAMESEADILGYGGAAGGGKTDLLLGLAATQHTKSVIFRRVFPNLRGIIERSREIFNPAGVPHSAARYNESLHRWMLTGGRMVEFEACQHEKDREKQRGRPRDFYGFDEATEFTKRMVLFIIAWLRSTRPDQRTRVILTFNPPIDESGNWVIPFFLPWFAHLYPDKFTHPNPARPGELRYYATIDGKETELESGDPFEHNGEEIQPLSRTFIPARLDDNPHLRDSGYRTTLQALPEPLRSQLLHGDFSAQRASDPWQALPTEWVRAAQARWLEREKPTTPLTAVGVDPARGGQDQMAVAVRHDNWFDLVSWPGSVVVDGPTGAALTATAIDDGDLPTYINIDVLGVGSSVYDSLKEMYKNAIPVNAAGKSAHRDKSQKFKMRNIRAEYYWRMRESLNPETGDNLALPPGNDIVADLCSAKYKVTAAGIQIESKDDIKKRIGRSPDKGEALLLALMPPGKGNFMAYLQGKINEN